MKRTKFVAVVCILATALMLTLFTLPTKAQADTYNGFTYTVSGGKATITDYTGSATDLTIPSALGGYPVTSIGYEAFRSCSSLTSVTIPDSVTSIGNYAFRDCDALTSVTIGDSVTSIGQYVFSGCTSLTGIWVDKDNANCSSDRYGVLFNKDKTTLLQAPCGMSGGYTIPDSVKSIGSYAFFYCEALTSVTIPDGVTSIGNYAFYNCNALTSVTIGDGVTSIGDYAFSLCDALTSITIPDSVTSIGRSAFNRCNNLTYNIYDNAKYLGNDNNPYLALIEATSDDITFCNIHPDTKIIYHFAFDFCKSLTSVTIPDGVTSIGDRAFCYCDSLTGIWVDENNACYCSDSKGVLFDKNKTTLIQAPGGIAGSYTIPDSVTSIGDYAFSSCESLTSVTIPDSVTSIGDYAFSGCKALTSVTIGNSVESIGDYAFYDCSSLTSVTIPDSVTSMGDCTFFCCYNLTSALIGDGVKEIGGYAFYQCGLSEVTIPDSVTTIGVYAFMDCIYLRSVTIGSGVTHIYTEAFDDCNSLTDVYYAGGQSQWNAISVADGNSSLTSATIHYQHIHDYTLIPPVRVENTCTEEGYIEYTCVYGDAYRETLPPAHKYVATVVAPTCTEQGYTVSTCTGCGDTKTTDKVAALGHDYSGTVTVVDPTCKEQGYTITACIRCDSVNKTNFTDTITHKMVLLPAVAPTCEKTGLTVGTACQMCGMVGVAQKEVAALGGNCDYTADPTTCGICGYVRADVTINSVVLRPTCGGLYFKGAFTFGAQEAVTRYGIAVSVYNELPVADDSDETSFYTIGNNSVLISNILDTSDGKILIYARPYVLLEDGTYIYGDVVATNLQTVVETISSKWETLTDAQKAAIADMYRQYTATMQVWLIPEIKEYV